MFVTTLFNCFAISFGGTNDGVNRHKQTAQIVQNIIEKSIGILTNT